MKYNIGLDLGITSIGWAVIGIDEEGNSTHIIDTNVTILESIEDDKGKLKNVQRRNARGARRTIRRRAYRVKRVKQLLNTIDVNTDSIYNISSKQQLNPYFLKTKGLEKELTKEELAICLIHYAKHRGFKSNRKNPTNKDEGALLEAIGKNKVYLTEHNLTVSQFLYQCLDDMNGNDKIKNSDGNYKFLFDRSTYENEINILLDKQIEYNVVDEKFKVDYIKIWSSQRDFSEGPGGDSPYAVDFAKAFGYCKFKIDGEQLLRAAKCAPTNEFSTLLQKLNNIKYLKDGNTVRLTPNEIQTLFEKAKTTTTLKYTHIVDVLGEEVTFNGLDLNKDKFLKVLGNYKKNDNIDTKENIDFKDPKFVEALNKEKYQVKVGALTTYHKLKKVFKDSGYAETFSNLPIEYLDDIVTGLTFYKTENKINNYFNQEGNQEHSELDWNMYPQIVNDVIPNIDTFNEAASLSLPLLTKLVPLLLEGNMYNEAMEQLGFDHALLTSSIEKKNKLPDMNIVKKDFPNELTNPRVERVLAATMAIINSLIERYGTPNNIAIETARDIANIRSKRGIIFNENMNNFENNQRLKTVIANEYKLKPINKITKDDIERLKLYEEQNGICMYSFEKITKEQLFSTDVQVDHIIPYSRSFNNSYNNKTLVFTKYNQEKKNRTPYEYFKQDKPNGYSKFVGYVEGEYKISTAKKKNYLAKEIDEEFKQRSLNDTSFITKYFTKILKTYLIIEGEVVGYKAGLVNSLKKSWDLQYLTHSLINENYRAQDTSKFNSYKVTKDGIKFEFTSDYTAKNTVTEVKLKEEKENTPANDIKMNSFIKLIMENSDKLTEAFQTFKTKEMSMHEIYDYIALNTNFNEEFNQSLVEVINLLNINYNKQQIKKDRSNHLHHALDAVCVGVINKKYEKNVTSFYQRIEFMKEDAKKHFDQRKEYPIKEAGEIVYSYEELEKVINAMWKNSFPKPYPNFDLEVKYRVYEQNKDRQQELFSMNFNDNHFRNIRPIFPVFKAIKRKTMQLHAETFYGSATFKDGTYLIKRVNVEDIKDEKGIQKIVEVKNGKEQIANIFREWIKNGKEGYPTLPNGREIKKIKIIDRTIEKSIKLAEDKYVAIDKVARIDIFASPNDDRLYFVQRNPVDINLEKNNEDFNVVLWWGQGKNKQYMLYSQIKKNYIPYKKLYPGDLIELVTKNGNSLCYTVGFSSGQLEFKSILGDGIDLVNSGINGKITPQFKATASTITSITKVKINNLGEIGHTF